MPFLLYVGNYPTNFQKDELLYLFRDFTVRVERMIYQGPKTCAFVNCKDICQARLIIKALNGTDVCGRKLIIKPPRNRQAYLHVIPELGKYEAADFEYLYGPEVSSLELKQAYSGRKSCDTADSLSVKPDGNILCEKMHLMSCGNSSNDQETFDTKNSINLKSRQSVQQDVIGENESHWGHWVRITNFPIGMCANVLSNLFSRYGSKDVKIIRNTRRVDGRLTEALVRLSSEDAVREAVLKFNHTYFWGRIISVEAVSNAGLCAVMHMHI